MKIQPLKFLLVTAVVLVAGPIVARAGYNPSDIISDRLYYNAGSMSPSGVQKFLEGYDSYLARYYVGQRSASQIIYEACRSYGLSPKVMLVMLQKEQSLVENKNPSETALRCATGYGSCAAKYLGFETQVDSAAWSLGVGYDAKKGQYNYEVGRTTVTQDGVPVTPANRATANLFIYNPVAGTKSHNGNYLFWSLWWNRYFGTSFPTGTLVQAKGQPGVYLIDREGRKHGFWGSSAFNLTFQPKQIVSVDPSDLLGLSDGDPIKLRDGAVFRAPNGAVFISQDNEKWGVPDRETLKRLGYHTSDAVPVNQTEVDLLPKGPLFDKDNLTRPNGTFIKIAENAAVYLLDQGKKRPFWDKQILNFNYNDHDKVVNISREEMERYPVGPAVKFRDGALLKGPSGGVYVIADGKKCGIASREVFDGLGYKMSNVITVRQAILDLHPNGATIKDY